MRRAYSSTGHQVVIEQIKQKDAKMKLMSSLSIHPAEYLPSNSVHNRTNRTSGVNEKHWEKGAVHTYQVAGTS